MLTATVYPPAMQLLSTSVSVRYIAGLSDICDVWRLALIRRACAVLVQKSGPYLYSIIYELANLSTAPGLKEIKAQEQDD